jgi:hypothetical protein
VQGESAGRQTDRQTDRQQHRSQPVPHNGTVRYAVPTIVTLSIGLLGTVGTLKLSECVLLLLRNEGRFSTVCGCAGVRVCACLR